eukprot:CAMPEP_0169142754 /NCGR_PEP_ID=MMETSP1015-20121227/45152_1 /TAXON_ID=342587 /ORGANISM="Karlodinium micrum, Strain CCMP2283" /LENGTH=467 /DNA_ID=CAMNT_0009209509 /DNA_START=61 /DNA_END=1461 /DNA_ORIENTATION=-
MRSIELRNGTDSLHVTSQHLALSSLEKQHHSRRILVGFMIVFFFSGAACGYLIPLWRHERVQDSGGVASCQEQEVEDVEDELEAGLDVILKWFPARAERIRERRYEIINHITSLTDPDANSSLRNLRLLPWRRKRKPSKMESTRSNLSIIRRLHGRPREMVVWENSTNCTLAVATFVSALLEFVTGFVRFGIPDKHAINVALLLWIGEMNTRFQYFKSTILYQKIVAFVFERNTRRKAEAIWVILKDAWDTGGGWLRFVFDYVVENGSDPWQILKFCIKFAARLVMWFAKGPAHFVGGIIFQLLNAKDMVTAGMKVMTMCNSSMVNITENVVPSAGRVDLVERYCALRAKSTAGDRAAMADLISSDMKVFYHKALSRGCNYYCDDGTCPDGGMTQFYDECPPLEEVPGTRQVFDDDSGNVTTFCKVKISLGFVGTKHDAKAIFSTTSKKCKPGVDLCINQIELGKVW